MKTLTLGLIGLDYAGEPLPAVFAAAQRRRLHCVELYLQINAAPGDAEAVSWLADSHGVRVVSISSMAKLNQAEADLPEHAALVRGSIELAAATGAPFATFMYGGNAGLEPVAARDRFLRRVAPLVEEAVRRGVVLLLENVFSRVPPGDLDSAERTLDVLERLDRRYVGLNLDLANYAIGGEEAYPYTWRCLRPYVRYMHLKDAARYRPDWHGDLGGRRPLQDHRRGTHISVPLGSGMLNYDGFLAELAGDGYDGAVALEPFAAGPQREEWLDRSLAYLGARGLYGGEAP